MIVCVNCGTPVGDPLEGDSPFYRYKGLRSLCIECRVILAREVEDDAAERKISFKRALQARAALIDVGYHFRQTTLSRRCVWSTPVQSERGEPGSARRARERYVLDGDIAALERNLKKAIERHGLTDEDLTW